jgi:hypothetical protein
MEAQQQQIERLIQQVQRVQVANRETQLRREMDNRTIRRAENQ